MTTTDRDRIRALVLQLAARYGLDPGKHPAIKEVLQLLEGANDDNAGCCNASLGGGARGYAAGD